MPAKQTPRSGLKDFALPFAAIFVGCLQSIALQSADAPARASAADHFNYTSIENAIGKGRFTEAQSALAGRLKVAPGDGYAHLLLGIALSELREPEPAEAQFREASRLRPRDPAAHTNWGNLLASRGQFAAATKQFDAALVLNPHDAASLYNLGSVRMSMKQYRAALSCFEAASSLMPRDVRTLLGLFQTQLKLNLSTLAGQTAERLLNVPAVDEQAIQIVGALQGEAGDYAGATRSFEKGAKIFPHSNSLLFNLGLALQKSGNTRRAAVVLENLRSKHDSAELENVLGEVYEQNGRFLEAVRSLQNAAEIEPANESYRFDYASELLAHLNFEAARLVAEPSVQRFPESVRLNVALGVALYGLERLQEAQALFLKTADRFPDAELPLLYVGLCAEATGTALPETQARLTDFYKRHPDKFMPAYLLGRLALNENDPASALTLLEASIKRRSDYAPSHFELGLALASLGRMKEAVEQYRTALKLDPNQTGAWYRLTVAYRKLGQTSLANEAEEEFRRKGESEKPEVVQTFLYSRGR